MRLSLHERRFAEELAREPQRLLAALSSRPSPGRVELLGRIEAGTQLTDRVVQMSVSLVRVWIDGLQAAGLAEQGGSTDLAEYRGKLSAFLKPVFIRMLNAVYAGASEEDLVACLLFIESDPGRRFHAALLDAVVSYYETAATAMAADLGLFLTEVRRARMDVGAATESAL
jgi:hypothetical protein